MAFFAGYIPLQKRNTLIRTRGSRTETRPCRAWKSSRWPLLGTANCELPGNIQAITEAPILARADGYIKRRMVDIGDRVQAGQPVAEIEAPELDQQVRQAKANLQQAQAALEQALANHEQGKSNLELARVTAERWGNWWRKAWSPGRKTISTGSSISRRSPACRRSKRPSPRSEQRSRRRSQPGAPGEMQSYRMVKAPFAGVITLRNVDVGALVNAGSTLLYRIAQTGRCAPTSMSRRPTPVPSAPASRRC